MMDEAAAKEIERLLRFNNRLLDAITDSIAAHKKTLEALAESERHRKQLSEYIETLAKGGIEAATGAGK